jgi:hypothetical protein
MNHEPSDSEIERDVSELRQLLARLEEPSEPHPAYWQNFLVHVRQRIDEERAPRRRWAPSVAWTSLTAAALVVVVALSGVLPMGVHEDPKIGVPAAIRSGRTANIDAREELGYTEGAQSLMLSKGDVKMLDAILDKSPDAVLEAMVEQGS